MLAFAVEAFLGLFGVENLVEILFFSCRMWFETYVDTISFCIHLGLIPMNIEIYKNLDLRRSAKGAHVEDYMKKLALYRKCSSGLSKNSTAESTTTPKAQCGLITLISAGIVFNIARISTKGYKNDKLSGSQHTIHSYSTHQS